MTGSPSWSPAPGTVRVRVALLRVDATVWSAVAHDLRERTRTIDGLGLEPQTLGALQRTQASFEQARALLGNATSRGAVAAEVISTTLTACADAYARDERENRHAVARIW